MHTRNLHLNSADMPIRSAKDNVRALLPLGWREGAVNADTLMHAKMEWTF
jgi:hypothetical protein